MTMTSALSTLVLLMVSALSALSVLPAVILASKRHVMMEFAARSRSPVILAMA